MSDYGIKVSQDGFDVLEADVDELSMSSKYGSRSIKLEGSVNLTTNTDSDWAEETVTHSFGYYPQLDAYTDLVNAGSVSLPGYYSFESNDAGCVGGGGVPHLIEEFRVKITSTTVVFGARYYLMCVIPMVGAIVVDLGVP